MPFELFANRFPEVGPRETRTITTLHPGTLPPDTYLFLEAYCNEQGCDCRRVFIHVVAESAGPGSPSLATLSWGWEDESFYRRWSSFELDDDDLHELKGPAPARLAPQSRYTEALLGHFEALIAMPDYAERIQRHYRMFRETVGGRGRKKRTVRRLKVRRR